MLNDKIKEKVDSYLSFYQITRTVLPYQAAITKLTLVFYLQSIFKPKNMSYGHLVNQPLKDN